MQLLIDSLHGHGFVTAGVVIQQFVVAAQAAVTGFRHLGNHQGHLLEETVVNHTASVPTGRVEKRSYAPCWPCL